MALRAFRPGRRLHFASRECNPSGTANIFLAHGSMACKEQFNAVADHLAAHSSTRAINSWDAYGCGRSDKPGGHPAAYAERELVEDAAAVVASLTAAGGGTGGGGGGSATNVLVGHSFGSNVVLQLAGRPALRPHIHGLVLLGSARSKPPTPSWLWALPRPLFNALRPALGRGFTARAFHPHTPAHVIAASARMNTSNESHVIQAFYAQVQWACTPLLADAAAHLPVVPTAVVTGASDAITTPGHAAEVAEALPWATLHLLPACGHMLLMEQPGAVAAVIATLVEEAVRARSAAGGGRTAA